MKHVPITLYLVRHAIAAERGDAYPDDSKRPLTDRGIRRFNRVARGLASLGVEVDLILTSPFARAAQTAAILAQHLPGKPRIVETAALQPEASFSQLIDELSRHVHAQSIALAGHQPSIGAFAARLAGCRGAFELKKGGACRIDVERLPLPAPGRLLWLATPKMLAGLRG